MGDVQVASTRQVLFSLLSVLLSGQPKASDLLIFGQFIASMLPCQLQVTEKRDNENEIEEENIVLRNKCLQVCFIRLRLCVHEHLNSRFEF